MIIEACITAGSGAAETSIQSHSATELAVFRPVPDDANSGLHPRDAQDFLDGVCDTYVGVPHLPWL
jgi:hypothetical protein